MYTGIVNIKLSSPFKWEGGSFETIDLDFGKVTGETIVNARRRVFTAGSLTFIPSLDPDYCAQIAAAISGIPYRALMKLPAEDFDAVWQTVGAFTGRNDPQEFYNAFIGAGEDGDSVFLPTTASQLN
jgi:hypothetical protein